MTDDHDIKEGDMKRELDVDEQGLEGPAQPSAKEREAYRNAAPLETGEDEE